MFFIWPQDERVVLGCLWMGFWKLGHGSSGIGVYHFPPFRYLGINLGIRSFPRHAKHLGLDSFDWRIAMHRLLCNRPEDSVGSIWMGVDTYQANRRKLIRNRNHRLFHGSREIVGSESSRTPVVVSVDDSCGS